MTHIRKDHTMEFPAVKELEPFWKRLLKAIWRGEW